MFSEFAPIQSEKVDEQAQRRLHRLMGQIIDKLYETPQLLNLAENSDDVYKWYTTNNSNPELNSIFKSIFKSLFDFYKFLYISFLNGEINDNLLLINTAILTRNKSRYIPLYDILLNEIGISIKKIKKDIKISSNIDILHSLKLLAENVPVNVNPWTPYALMNFVCCSFTNDFSFLLARIEQVRNLSGLLHKIQKSCLENGYGEDLRYSFGPAGFDFNIFLRNKIGGFVIGYNPRKDWQFHFGSLNSIGLKAMLEDFDNLDNTLKKHLIAVCKTCNGCLACTKGGKNKVFATKLKYNDQEYNFCYDNYGRHNWKTINHDLAEALFKYHVAQEIYGSVLKNK